MRLKLLVLALGAGFLLLSGFRPGALPYTPDAVYSDAVTSHLPAAQFLRASVLESGAFPLWRETIMAGQPFAADPLNKTAYPLQWLALLLPPVLHLDLMIALHWLIAGAGMWCWARSLGLRQEAAALSALAYVLAPRLVGHTGAGHLDLLYALAWFPWLMWSVPHIARSNNFVGAGFKPALVRIVYVTLFAALMLLADVRLSLFAFALAAAYAFYQMPLLKRLSRLPHFVLAALLVVLLTLSLTVPLLAWRPYLSRGTLTAEESGVFSLTLPQMVGLLLPPAGGNIESLTYLGLPVLALALIGAAAARQWFWIVVVAVAAFYALGSNGWLWSLLVRVIPALLWFRVPSRAWLVIALVAPLLAGYGLQALLDRADQHSRRAIRITLIATTAVLASGIFLILRVPAINGLAVLVGAGGFGIACLLAFVDRLSRQRLALALLAITFADLALAGRGWLEWRSSDAWLPAGQVQLAERLTELDAYRVYSPDYSLEQQVAEEYHLRLFGGVDPFQLTGVVQAIEQGAGMRVAGYSVVMPPLSREEPTNASRTPLTDTSTLAQWGVTHVVAAFPLAATTLEQVDLVAGVYVYANRDPALTTHFPTTPAWAPGWDSLPDSETVAALNQLTLVSALISGAGFAGVLALLAATKGTH